MVTIIEPPVKHRGGDEGDGTDLPLVIESFLALRVLVGHSLLVGEAVRLYALGASWFVPGFESTVLHAAERRR